LWCARRAADETHTGSEVSPRAPGQRHGCARQIRCWRTHPSRFFGGIEIPALSRRGGQRDRGPAQHLGVGIASHPGRCRSSTAAFRRRHGDASPRIPDAGYGPPPAPLPEAAVVVAVPVSQGHVDGGVVWDGSTSSSALLSEYARGISAARMRQPRTLTDRPDTVMNEGVGARRPASLVRVAMPKRGAGPRSGWPSPTTAGGQWGHQQWR
jgi:hypothetical protein